LAVMGVHVDQTGDRDQIRGVDLPLASGERSRRFDRGDALAVDTDVRPARPVLEHRIRAADDHVVHDFSPDPPIYRTPSLCAPLARTSMSSSRSTCDRSQSTIIGITSLAYCL